MRVPKLRFPEFLGEWDEMPLSSAWRVKGKRNYDNLYSREQVLSVSGDKGVVNQIQHMGRSYAGASVENYHVVETGDAVYTKSPLKTNPFGIIKVNKGSAGIVSTLYAVYEIYSENDPDFWHRYFELDDRTNSYLMPLVHIGAKNDMKINNERVLIDPVLVPTLPEQRKIASFFDALDAKLHVLVEKRVALTGYKSAMLHRLFGQQVRFTQNDGSAFPDWDEIQLGKVVSFHKGKGIAKSDIAPDGETLCIRYGELYTLYNETIEHVFSRTNVPTSDLFLSQSNDVVVPASGEIALDMARASCVLKSDVALGGDINILRSQMDGTFLAYLLTHAKRVEIAKLAQGNSVVHLYAAQLKGLVISVPHADEQRKIAEAISSVDAKIQAIVGQISQFENFKKGLLEQMFA